MFTHLFLAPTIFGHDKKKIVLKKALIKAFTLKYLGLFYQILGSWNEYHLRLFHRDYCGYFKRKTSRKSLRFNMHKVEPGFLFLVNSQGVLVE